MTPEPKECRLCPEPATVTRTFLVSHNNAIVTHSTCAKHDDLIRTGMLETGWVEGIPRTRECAAPDCERLLPSWMPFCARHMQPWRCEAHNLTTTGDCPKCDEEMCS